MSPSKSPTPRASPKRSESPAAAGTPELAWDELWQELYHQGDIGVGCFVAVPHIVRVHLARGTPDWNAYGLVAAIEGARAQRGNPDVPEWCRAEYLEAIRTLARRGLVELPGVQSPGHARQILAVLAMAFGSPLHGRVLAELAEDELEELVQAIYGA